jgi:hypothetical protein
MQTNKNIGLGVLVTGLGMAFWGWEMAEWN